MFRCPFLTFFYQDLLDIIFITLFEVAVRFTLAENSFWIVLQAMITNSLFWLIFEQFSFVLLKCIILAKKFLIIRLVYGFSLDLFNNDV